MSTKIKVSKKAAIRVLWSDDVSEYTVEKRNRITTYFKEKYKVNKVNVVFKPKIGDNGSINVLEASISENVSDPVYQAKLFRNWLENHYTGDIDEIWPHIMKLDSRVNEKVSQSGGGNRTRYRNWVLKKIEFDNFLSYGDGNSIDYTSIPGVNVISGADPYPNQTGKTTLTVDLPLFLFFGSKATTKSKTDIEIFNTYTNKDTVRVKGYIEIDGIEYVIERTIKRSPKRDGSGYTTSGSLKYFEVLSDGTTSNLEGEQKAETEKIIGESIGTEEDFILTIIATGNNLESLIDTKPTERGKLFTRFVGLDIIEEKEDACKSLQSTWAKGLKSDQYNIEELNNDNIQLETDILELEKVIVISKEDVIKIDSEIKSWQTKKDEILGKKVEIPDRVKKLNPNVIKDNIKTIDNDIEIKRRKITECKVIIDDINDVEFDTEKYNNLLVEDKATAVNIGKGQSECDRIIKLIKTLKSGGTCPTCKQALKDIDHTAEIEENEGKVTKFTTMLEKLTTKATTITSDIKGLNKVKENIDKKEKNTLLIDKFDIEIERLELDKVKENDNLELYNNSQTYFDKNAEIDAKVVGFEAAIERLNRTRDSELINQQRSSDKIELNKKDIKDNINTIAVIKQEEDIKKIYKVYLDIVGKKGISKLILTAVLPTINAELDRLLQDSTDFRVEVALNDKKELKFNLIKSEVTKDLSSGSGFEKTISSMALRSILGRISVLSKPNIMIWDECLGKVADKNLPKMNEFITKLGEMYPTMLIISPSELVKDWADNIIMVTKNEDISSVSVK